MGALTFGAFGRREQPVLVQRSVHSSFIDGIILAGLTPVFMQPLIDDRYGIAHGISPAELERTLASTENPKGVYVVTPSYFGAVANVAELAEIAHAAGVPLMVDEAWGADFGFHPELPQNSLSLGAGLVVSSTHKLGGSLTQSAMIHLNDGPFADALDRLESTDTLAYADTHTLSLPHFGELSMRPRDAWFAPAVKVPAYRAVGRVSSDSLAAYPPGIPNVMPGEVITDEVVSFLRTVAASPGGYVRGATDPAVDFLRVVAD